MKNLKMLREQAGLSQQKLADNLGLVQQSVHNYENGSYEPDITTLIKCAEFFETSVDFLIGNTDIKRKIEKTTDFELNDKEVCVINKYRSFTPKRRELINIIFNALVEW